MAKPGRPYGSKDSYQRDYTVTPIALAQRRKNAMEFKNNKTGMILGMTNCAKCPVVNNCHYMNDVVEDLQDDSIPTDKKTKCPMFDIYKESFVNILKSPIVELAKDISIIQVKMAQQNMVDNKTEKVFSREFLQAMKLKLEAAKVYGATIKLMDEKKRNNMYSKGSNVLDEETVIDIDLGEEEESKDE